MTESYESSYPSASLLTIHNVSNWVHYLQRKLTAYPDKGQAIRQEKPFVLTQPNVNDLFPETNIRKYNIQPDNLTTLTDSSRQDFLKVNSTFEKRDQRRREEEAKVCTLILSSLSEEAQMHLRSIDSPKPLTITTRTLQYVHDR
jgi:hypothetical protein